MSRPRRRPGAWAIALILLARVVAEDYYGGDVIQGGHFMDDEMPLMDDECPDDSFDVRNRRRLHRGARGGARARPRGAAGGGAGARPARAVGPAAGVPRARARADSREAPVPSQDAALAVAREFVLSNAGDGAESCGAGGDDYGDVDAYGAFRAAASAAAGVEKATALAIVLLVIEHGAAPFDDPEVVALCRSLDPDARESLVSSLEEYFGDFYDSAAVELGALRYALLSNEEKRAAMAEMSAHGYDALPEEASFLLERLGGGGFFEDDDVVELWIDVLFFLLVFGALCALSAMLRRAYSLAARARALRASEREEAREKEAAEERASRRRRRGEARSGAKKPPPRPRPKSPERPGDDAAPSSASSSSSSSDDDAPEANGFGAAAAAPRHRNGGAAARGGRPKAKAREAARAAPAAPPTPRADKKKAPKGEPKAAERRSRGDERRAKAQQRADRDKASSPRPPQPAAAPAPASRVNAWAAPDPPRPPPQTAPGLGSPPAAPRSPRGVAPRAAPRPPDVAASVKVLPVPPGATGGDLVAAFARYGGVLGARVDRGGVAYVDFATRNCAVAAAFDAHGRPLFAGGDAVSCIVRERSNSLDGPPPPAFPAFGGFGDGVQSDLRADAPAFGERPFAAEDDGLDRLPAGVL